MHTDEQSLLNLRILQIIGSMDPATGGPAESVRRIVSNYPSLGDSGEVVTLDNPDAPFLKELDIIVHPLGPHTLKDGYSSRLVPWLKENAHRFDAVIVHGLWQYHGRAVMNTFAGNKPYAVLCHGMLDPWFKRAYPLKHFKKWLYWLLVEYWVLRRAHRVIFTTNNEENFARQSFWLHHWSGKIVPYGAQVSDDNPTHLQTAFLSAMPQLKEKRFLLFLGRIHPKKGCDLLLHAFAKIALSDPDLDLVIAGPDQTGWQSELQLLSQKLKISDRVHWPGMLNGDIKWGAFYSCEAFILPSHQENFGIAVAEALACGKPVLISDKVNICDGIIADHAGLVAPDTHDGTLNLLTRWIEMGPIQREQMGANAKQCFTARFDMRVNVRQIIRMFAEVADANNTMPHKKSS